MANIKSAIKRAEVAEIRTRRNNAVRSMIKTSVRRLEETLKGTDPEKATGALSRAFSHLDKAVSKGVIHKNEANRSKARLSRRVEEFKNKSDQA